MKRYRIAYYDDTDREQPVRRIIIEAPDDDTMKEMAKDAAKDQETLVTFEKRLLEPSEGPVSVVKRQLSVRRWALYGAVIGIAMSALVWQALDSPALISAMYFAFFTALLAAQFAAAAAIANWVKAKADAQRERE